MIKGQYLLLKFQRIAQHYHNENTAKTDMAKMRPSTWFITSKGAANESKLGILMILY